MITLAEVAHRIVTRRECKDVACVSFVGILVGLEMNFITEKNIFQIDQVLINHV